MDTKDGLFYSGVCMCACACFSTANDMDFCVCILFHDSFGSMPVNSVYVIVGLGAESVKLNELIRQNNQQTSKHEGRQVCRQAGMQTGMQTGRHADRQACRQIWYIARQGILMDEKEAKERADREDRYRSLLSSLSLSLSLSPCIGVMDSR